MVNRKFTFMYLFDLIMSKHLPRECSKRKIFSINSAELTGKQQCAGVSFIKRVQAAWIGSNFYVHILPSTGVFQ